MASYQVLCTEQVPAWNHPRQARIVAVGTGVDGMRPTHRWTVPEVVSAMDTGHTFFTKGQYSGRTARVEKYYCSTCRAYHIRSAADCTTDNNLDSLNACPWAA